MGIGAADILNLPAVGCSCYCGRKRVEAAMCPDELFECGATGRRLSRDKKERLISRRGVRREDDAESVGETSDGSMRCYLVQ